MNLGIVKIRKLQLEATREVPCLPSKHSASDIAAMTPGFVDLDYTTAPINRAQLTRDLAT